MLRQFASFALVGAAGFLVDAGLLLALIGMLGPYGARLASFAGAATFTWALNRRLTFPGAREAGSLAQWLMYLAANAGGGSINLAVYCAAIAAFDAPALGALACGSAAGLLWNFLASRYLMFRPAAGPLQPQTGRGEP